MLLTALLSCLVRRQVKDTEKPLSFLLFPSPHSYVTEMGVQTKAQLMGRAMQMCCQGWEVGPEANSGCAAGARVCRKVPALSAPGLLTHILHP